MNNSLWDAGALSIILIPSGKQGSELLDLARDWTARGLLGPAAWVRPEAVELVEGAPPKVGAIVIASDGGTVIEQELDLFEVLASQSLSRVRLIKVRSAVANQQLDEIQDAISEEVTTYLRFSMPMAIPGTPINALRSDLLRISLICAPTDLQLDKRVKWAEHDSSVLVVASPEDRATPTAGDAFVRDNERFVGFVLLHVATIGGLWNGLPIGSLELFERHGSAPKSIWIPRVFVSGVLTDGLAQRTAARVLADILQDEGAVAATGAIVTPHETAVITDANVPLYVDQMVSAAMELDAGALRFQRSAIDDVEPPKPVKFFQLLRLFGGFSLEKVGRIPHWIGIWFADAAARRANRVLLRGKGDDEAESYRIVPLRGDQELDARDQILLDTAARATAADETARKTLSGPPTMTTRRTTPGLWAGLRELTFGSLDGSWLGTPAPFAELDEKTPVFAAVPDIVPNPDNVWTYGGVAPLPPTVPPTVTWRIARESPAIHDELRAIETRAEEAVTELTAHREAEAEKLSTASAENDELRIRLLEAGLLKRRANGTVGPAPRTKATKSDPAERTDGLGQGDVDRYLEGETRIAAINEAIASLDAEFEPLSLEVDAARAEVDSFDLWLNRLRQSFVWKSLDQLDETRNEAQNALKIAETTSSIIPPPGELIRLRKRFHRGLIRIWTILAILTAIAIALPPLVDWLLTLPDIPEWVTVVLQYAAQIFRSEYYPEWWQLLLIGLAAMLLVLPALLAAYHSGWMRFERRVQRTEHEIYSNADRILSLRGEVQRLVSLHSQATEWFETLSDALYHPWAVPPKWLDTGLGELDTSRMPFALHVAQAATDNTPGGDRMRRSAAQSLVRAGWRSHVFADLVDAVRAKLGLDADRFGVASLDGDLPEASNNSRRRLRAHMGDEDVLHEVARRSLATMVADLQRGALYDSDAQVEPIGFDPMRAFRGLAGVQAAPPTTWMDFLMQTLETARDVPTPLSPLGIASGSMPKAWHEKVTSYVLAPERIAKDLGDASNDKVKIEDYPPTAHRSFDAVVRIDMIGPVPFDAINLFSETSRRVDADLADQVDDIFRCEKCGRTNCPAADPSTDLECDYAI
jgi:hypothetical protein